MPFAARLPIYPRLRPEARRDLESAFRRHLGALSAQALAADPDLRSWPVLQHLLDEVTAFWVRNTAAMLRRLDEDYPSFGPVTRIEAGLSDPHDGGQTVHVLHFEGERRLVYKPRSLGAEAAFAETLEWCNERGLSLELRGARAIDRGDYGWMDFVSQEPCRSKEEVRRFHRRAGMLLGLLHALGSRDCHYENLIAHGEHPVLIDLEALLPVPLRKWLPGEGLGEAWYLAAARLEGSVLSTGLLPRWQEGRRRGELHAVGGIGGGHPEMRLERVDHAWREVWRDAQPNVPILDGRPVEPWPYRDEMSAGFSEMYRLLLRHRAELLEPTGPLRGIGSLKTRLVLRSTAIYHRLLERSLGPEECRDAEARRRALEPLRRAYREGAPRTLLEAEMRALEQGDIPRFMVSAEGGGAAEGFLERTSLEAVRARLEGLGQEDLQMQIGFIHASLAPSLKESPETRQERSGTADFLATASQIASRLRDLAIQGKDGSVVWIGPRFLKHEEAYELAVLGPDLYAGTSGIALFLAAFSSVTGDRAARELALRAIAPLRDPEWRNRTRLGIGGMTGISSVMYALGWIGELLGEADLIAEALRLTALLTPERIAADRALDVLAGAAGTLLALLAIDALAPEGPALEIAGLCADHLLAHLPRAAARLPGFAHGPAGIGHALLQLAERTGRRELRKEALRLLEDPGDPSRHTWCRGIPGVALARLGYLDVSALLTATRSAPLSTIDHLCCGNLGRAEVLLEAGLPDEARETAGHVLVRAAAAGGFGCAPFGAPGLMDPTLFRGEAGIGLALLRLAGHGDLPGVLRLASPGTSHAKREAPGGTLVPNQRRESNEHE